MSLKIMDFLEYENKESEVDPMTFEVAKMKLVEFLSGTTCEVEAIDMARRIWRSFDDPKQFKELIDIYWAWHLKNVVNKP